MTILRGFSTKSSTRLSFLVLTAILLLVSRTRALNPVANDQVLKETQSLDGEDTSERRDAIESSARIRTRNNSPALNHFLEDVLNAQDELKWIDRAVHRSENPRNIESSFPHRKARDRETREEYDKPQSIYLEEELKAKRKIDDKRSSDAAPSLASLKRTIIQLSDSLNPRESGKRGTLVEETNFDGKRKLLSSQDIRSAMGIAIEYYDYEDDGEREAAMMNRQEEMPANPLPVTSLRPAITKNDKNAAEERKEDLMRQNLKNKIPKQEFLSDEQEPSPEKEPPPVPNSLYNSLVLRRIPASEDSESSDFYSQCEVGSSRNAFGNEENSHLKEKNYYIEADEGSVYEKIDEPKFSKERTYLVVSPSVQKRTKKRSFSSIDGDGDEASSMLTANSDKSARNYAALKITDDMFKGGVEQSNPLGEDKPIVESKSFSSPAFSSSPPSSVNSLVSSRSFRTKTTSPEWKVIEVARNKKFEPRYSMHSDRGFGRCLKQTFSDSPLDNANTSSVLSVSSTTDNQSHETISLTQPTNASNEIIEDAATIQHPQIVHENSTIDAKLTVSEREKTTFLPGVTKIRNNTRLRRHADSFNRENIPKRRKHKIHRRHKNRKNTAGRKRQSTGAEDQQRKLTVLLAADNIEDESQIDLAVHGELAGKIVERIFEQVQRNQGLKVALGPGLYRKHKPQESMALEKMYRQGLDENEVKETEMMMRRVMELLGRLVLDEVRRKTCASLAPDMRDFLQWTLGFEEMAGPLSDQNPPLPIIPGHRHHEATEKTPPSGEKFLFPNSNRNSGDLTELERKVNLLKGLINEYHALTEREKTKVQTVHDYLGEKFHPGEKLDPPTSVRLSTVRVIERFGNVQNQVRQLSLLVRYIETKEAADVSGNLKTARAEFAPQQILQYQASVPNSSLTDTSHNSLKSSDARASHQYAYSMFSARPMVLPYLNDNSHASERQSGLWTGREKRTREILDLPDRIRREGKNIPGNEDTGESIEYRKLLRQIATLRRRKRAYSWGYEKPRIYLEPKESSDSPDHHPSSISSRTQSTESTALLLSSLSNTLDANTSLPVRGKNRLEDEVFLLNKREAWRKENKRLLEEVAFGKDTRDDLIPETLSGVDEAREKRAYDEKTTSHTLSKRVTNSPSEVSPNFESQLTVGSIEQRINVFPVEPGQIRTIKSVANLRTNHAHAVYKS